MKDFEKEKLKNKDYLDEYIKAETDNIGENKLIDVISNILFQVFKLEIELLNYFNNNLKKLPVDKTKKRSNEFKIDFNNSNSLYVLFTNIQNKIFDKPQVGHFLEENEELLKSIWTEDRVNLRITIFNIMLLIISFKKIQLDKKQNNQIKQPKVSNLDDIQNHGGQWNTVDKPSSRQKRNHPESNSSEISDSDCQSITPEVDNSDGDSTHKKNNQMGITSPPISLNSKVNVLDHKSPSPNQTETGSTDDSHYPINGIVIWVLPLIGLVSVLGLVVTVLILLEVKHSKDLVLKNSKDITKQLGDIYTPEKDGKKDYGYLKTQFEKISKLETSDIKQLKPGNQESLQSKNATSAVENIAPQLQTDLNNLNGVIEKLMSFKLPEVPKGDGNNIQIKLDDAKIKEVFNSIVKDENSDFGKMIKKINGTGDKKSEKIVDTTSIKDKNDLASFKSEIDKLKKSISDHEKEISKEKASVNILNGEVDKKTKEINNLEAKIKSIGDEKTGFKGLTGSFAILFTNSKDFPLNNSILSTAITLIEKQPKNQNIGVYIATGNQIAANLDLRDKKEKSLNIISPTGSPTEMLGDAGQAFLDYAFDGKNPIPVPDRKAIIIATWSAEAPKFNSSGWKDISQVDAILIQPANVQQIRYAKSWLDFVNEKNGRLLLISGGENIDAGSKNLNQLEKHLSTLLNTKKD